jgi:hypothetical protein
MTQTAEFPRVAPLDKRRWHESQPPKNIKSHKCMLKHDLLC